MDLLISKVQKRTVLWNKRDSKFDDRVVVDREWVSVKQLSSARNPVYK